MLIETRLPTLSTDEYGHAMTWELESVMLMTPTADPECGGGQLAAPEERGGVKGHHYAASVTNKIGLGPCHFGRGRHDCHGRHDL